MEQGFRSQDAIQRERAVLVCVLLPGDEDSEDVRIGELHALADTAGVQVVGRMVQARRRPDGRTYIGKGKAEELAAMVTALQARVVLFDNDLSPSQLQHVEEVISCKVLDRTELILDIFATRATNRAAQLQVEIAQLEYTAPRLREMWSHLGQVTGGAPMGVGTRGPGEKQIEVDRRLVSRRLTLLKRELSEVQARRSREVEQRRREHFTVCLVGYTNAGKSTLFNAITPGGAYADDKLFATLQSRVEQWNVGAGDTVMLADTVGFIRDLPHRLVASFRSTLEDATSAHLLLLVVDAADPQAAAQLATVRKVLAEIGATVQPRVLVLNKCDLLAAEALGQRIAELAADEQRQIPVSGLAGTGLEELRAEVRTIMLGEWRSVCVDIPLRDGRAIDLVERRGEVLERDFTTEQARITVRLSRRHLEQLTATCPALRLNDRSPREALAELFPQQAPPAPPRRGLHDRAPSEAVSRPRDVGAADAAE